jgi:galactokinase/mevalonate kinase-like predicted kinase
MFETVPTRLSVLCELQDRGILAFTGASHFSGDNLRAVQGHMRNGSRVAKEAWRRLEGLAREARQLLLSESLPASVVIDRLAELVGRNWQSEAELTGGAVQHGGLAAIEPDLAGLGHGKLTGAGAGGHYFFIAKSVAAKEEARRILQRASFTPVPWKVATEPAQVHTRFVSENDAR